VAAANSKRWWGVGKAVAGDVLVEPCADDVMAQTSAGVVGKGDVVADRQREQLAEVDCLSDNGYLVWLG